MTTLVIIKYLLLKKMCIKPILGFSRLLRTFKWVAIPFYLKNIGVIYQIMMYFTFYDIINKFLEVYLDDMVMKSKTKESHLRDLLVSFEWIRFYRLKLNYLNYAFKI
jgi:hypothetical protein